MGPSPSMNSPRKAFLGMRASETLAASLRPGAKWK